MRCLQFSAHLGEHFRCRTHTACRIRFEPGSYPRNSFLTITCVPIQGVSKKRVRDRIYVLSLSFRFRPQFRLRLRSKYNRQKISPAAIITFPSILTGILLTVNKV